MSSQRWDAELYEARHSFVWQLGEELIAKLDPRPGERILDVGCGTGQLTAKIAESGAQVLGLDASADMIGQARQNFPRLTFLLQDATAMDFDSEFDAVFSNAALHWILDAQETAGRMSKALKPGGRLVIEFGGVGNIQTIERAITSVINRFKDIQIPPRRTYYPSIGAYTAVLERAGFEIREALLFDRPTPLAGVDGMDNWIRQFKWFYFEVLPAEQRTTALREVISELEPVLYNSNGWFADYRRLRIAAIKV